MAQTDTQPIIKSSPQNYHQNIPQALKDIPHWVLWTLIDNDKVPCTIRTAFQKKQATPIKWADTSTHLTFEQAISYYTEHYNSQDLPDLGGIGLILNKSHSANITCIDIDRLLSKLDQRITNNQKLLPLLQESDHANDSDDPRDRALQSAVCPEWREESLPRSAHRPLCQVHI